MPSRPYEVRLYYRGSETVTRIGRLLLVLDFDERRIERTEDLLNRHFVDEMRRQHVDPDSFHDYQFGIREIGTDGRLRGDERRWAVPS